MKGGDYRAREANVYRLAEVSVDIIDLCVAQGVPVAREYGGLLDTRSFAGAQVERTFYARGQTGQQLLLGAYQAMLRQVDAGRVTILARREMLDLVIVDGRARGIIARNLVTGEMERHSAHAVLLCTGGYGNVYFLSTNAGNSNVTAAWRCARRGAYFANPSFVQVHPTCIPVSGSHQSKLTLMNESLRNDGRVWGPRDPEDKRPPDRIPEDARDYYLHTGGERIAGRYAGQSAARGVTGIDVVARVLGLCNIESGDRHFDRLLTDETLLISYSKIKRMARVGAPVDWYHSSTCLCLLFSHEMLISFMNS